VANVVLVGGHLIDAAERPVPRFPSSRAGWVADRVREVFDQWDVGPATTVICGGARGADIIAAEQARARGAHLVLCLALPVEQFERESVDLPGTEWNERFRSLVAVADVRFLRDEVTQARRDHDEVFARTNEWMVDLARQLDPHPRALIVWDGKPGDGPGGAADLVERIGPALGDGHVHIIDPTPP
jgi:hypothetical protein